MADPIRIPEHELVWTYSRSSGPGGQNLNKVASKATLRWNVRDTASLPNDVRIRLLSQEKGRITLGGDLILRSQRFRDQERNKRDCLEKLRTSLAKAWTAPKKRRPTRPTRSSRKRRLEAKQRRSKVKRGRRVPQAE